jgi:CheY-like chemotaxis protein
MRKLLLDINKSDDARRPEQIEILYRRVRSFACNANMAGLSYVAKFGAAIEALMKEMLEKPKTVTASTLRTMAHAIDFLSELTRPGLPSDIADHPPIEVLVVDDDMLSRRALTLALEKAFLKAAACEDPEAALARVQSSKFDLIFLDVNMPGMDGFEVCDRLRQAGLNKNTPVIFVTSSNDFQVRAQSTLRGASDLIAKPFMFIELTVKALTFSLRHRIEALKQVQNGTLSSAGPPRVAATHHALA